MWGYGINYGDMPDSAEREKYLAEQEEHHKKQIAYYRTTEKNPFWWGLGYFVDLATGKVKERTTVNPGQFVSSQQREEQKNNELFDRTRPALEITVKIAIKEYIETIKLEYSKIRDQIKASNELKGTPDAPINISSSICENFSNKIKLGRLLKVEKVGTVREPCTFTDEEISEMEKKIEYCGELFKSVMEYYSEINLNNQENPTERTTPTQVAKAVIIAGKELNSDIKIWIITENIIAKMFEYQYLTQDEANNIYGLVEKMCPRKNNNFQEDLLDEINKTKIAAKNALALAEKHDAEDAAHEKPSSEEKDKYHETLTETGGRVAKKPRKSRKNKKARKNRKTRRN